MSLFCLLPLNNSYTDEFIRLSLKFSSKSNLLYDLHHAFGIQYASQGFFYDAEYHLIQGNVESASLLGSMDWEWSRLHSTVDSGYFLARSVVLYVSMGKIDHAQHTIQSFLRYISTTPTKVMGPNSIEISFTDSGLINFSQLLVSCVLYGSVDQYRQLLTLYQKELGSVDGFLFEVRSCTVF